MSAPFIDYSQWPCVEVIYQPSMTAEDLDTYRDALDELYKRGTRQPFVCVVDTRNAPAERATLSVRRQLVGIVNDLAKQYPNAMLAEAVILEGELAASLYMAYTWLIRNKRTKRRGFRTREDAVVWAEGFLQAPEHKDSKQAKFNAVAQRPPTQLL